MDDTLCKGVESWAWYGLQPVNRLIKPNGTLIVTSREKPETLIADVPPQGDPYQLAILKGTPSFSGLWVYKDDHTDVRILGAIAKFLPELFSLESCRKLILDEWQGALKATSAQRAYERLTSVTVQPESRQSRKSLMNSRCPSGTRCATASPFPASLLATQMKDPNHASNGRISAGAQPHFQEVRDAHDAAGAELRHLHQVHALLAAMSGLLLRCDAGRPVRREYGSLLRLRRCEAVCPVKDCVTMVNEVAFQTTPASGKPGGRTKTATRPG